jgi:uncharacterized protein YacL
MTNFLRAYLDSASPAELAELQKLADLDNADDRAAIERGLQVLREFGPAALDDTVMPEDEAAQLLAALER